MVTLGRKQMLAVAKKAGMSEKHLQEIGELLGKAKKPQVDIGYKVSDQGFTVAAARFRDGKRILGNGAVSVTDLGTETPAIKMRMSVGENGKYYTGRSWVDLGGNYNIDDVAMNVALKNGIWAGSSHVGTFAAGSGRLNAKATVDDLMEAIKKNGEDLDELQGLSYQSAIDKVNELANSWLKILREAVSGKQKPIYDKVDKVADLGDIKAKSVKEIFEEFRKNKNLNVDKKIDEKLVKDIFEKRPAEGKNINLDKFKEFLDGQPGTGKKSFSEALDETLS